MLPSARLSFRTRRGDLGLLSSFQSSESLDRGGEDDKKCIPGGIRSRRLIYFTPLAMESGYANVSSPLGSGKRECEWGACIRASLLEEDLDDVEIASLRSGLEGIAVVSALGIDIDLFS